VIHVDGRVNPVEDVATINFELALSDLLQVERRIDKLKKGKAKSPTEKAQEAIELEVLKRISLSLESGIPVRVLKLSEEESLLLSTLNLLTQKPCIYAANVCESDLRTKRVCSILQVARGLLFVLFLQRLSLNLYKWNLKKGNSSLKS